MGHTFGDEVLETGRQAGCDGEEVQIRGHHAWPGSDPQALVSHIGRRVLVNRVGGRGLGLGRRRQIGPLGGLFRPRLALVLAAHDMAADESARVGVGLVECRGDDELDGDGSCMGVSPGCSFPLSPFRPPLHIVAGIDSLAWVLVRAMTVVRVEWRCDGNMSAVKIVFPKRKITV